ncbi:DUF3105 domain-containing protein [Actinophytocola sp.]|uniref:DUF3105 domain-containing protein n=1 Tax=Actinophytocola sp. TaxID=1872138 RepID=UPI00389B2EB9
MLTAAVLVGCTVSRGSDSAAGPSTDSPTSTSASRSSEFTPDEDNRDPAKNIEGVVVTDYSGAVHAQPGQRVAYTKAPPDGGRHDPVWANCGGTVYAVPVRNEHMVHALEHGAVWIAYNADQITGGDLAKLTERVEGVPYMMLSPYPALDAPISLQAWGHQLKLDDPDDPRVDQFIEALRENQYTSPEPGARCDSQDTGFDPANPPPFDATPPGPDAAPVGP